MKPYPKSDLNSIQQKLIRTVEYLHNETQLNEIDSLINFYFEKKLDLAIEKVEMERNYSAAIYEEWLENKQRK